MRTIKLTKGQVALVDDGSFNLLSQYRWHAGKNPNGKFYARRKSNGENEHMHRMILNAPNGLDVDHVNGDSLDNRRANLRLCTRSENNMNRGVQCNNSSGYKGVTWNKRKNKFCAQIRKEKRHYHCGYFDKPKDAAISYDMVALMLYGDFAITNILKVVQKK